MEKQYDAFWRRSGAINRSNEFKDLMIKMLNYDPELRPSFEEIVNHPWLNVKINPE